MLGDWSSVLMGGGGESVTLWTSGDLTMLKLCVAS